MQRATKSGTEKKAAALKNSSSQAIPHLSDQQLLWSYRTMLLSRLLDEKTITLYKQNKCHFQISCAGHEGIQVATAKIFRAGQDWFYPYYRDMALVVDRNVA